MDMAKSGIFTMKGFYHRYFPSSSSSVLRIAIDVLLTNLLLTSRSDESKQNLNEE